VQVRLVALPYSLCALRRAVTLTSQDDTRPSALRRRHLIHLTSVEARPPRVRPPFLVTLVVVVLLAAAALALLRDSLRKYTCDASGIDPRCRISNAPGP
jgi:hypothetical protein